MMGLSLPRLLLLGLALSVPGLAGAETARRYDERGRYIGRVERQGDGGVRRLYDERGRYKGRAERQGDGGVRLYDERGRYRGRQERR